MSANTVLVAIVLLCMVAAMVREWARPVVVFLLALCVFMAAGVIRPQAAFAGFSNETLFVIGSLFIITYAIEQTIDLSRVLYKMIGNAKHVRFSLLRMMLPVTILSGFLNNTPVVSMLVPQVGRWANKHNVSASLFLMPLSFAAILGGTLTLVGTSTNLAVSGLLMDRGYESIGFFDFALVGIPVVVLGTLLVMWRAPRVLPRRHSVFDQDPSQLKQFTFTAKVQPMLKGKTSSATGLYSLEGVYLYELLRGKEVIPVTPQTRLEEGDTLSFIGQADAPQQLSKLHGLQITGTKHVDKLPRNRSLKYYEVVIDNSSPLTGSTLKEKRFRDQYGAAVVAINRAGRQVSSKPANTRLRAGDTLLVVADDLFYEVWSERKDFLAVFPLEMHHASASHHSVLTLGIVGAALMAAILGVMSLPVALLSAAGSIIATKVISVTQAKRVIDFEVLLLIGAALGVARAVEESGAAEWVAQVFTDSLGAFGPVGVLAGVIVATVILTELITNSGAALLMLPIALNATQSLGVSPHMVAIAVAVAASASFNTPVGYQTNTMVYGPGGYKFSDYIRLGWLPTAGMIAVLLVVIPLLW